MSKDIHYHIVEFIKRHKDLISEGNWSDLFEESRYELTKYERWDLSLLLKDADIIIPIQDVFPKEKNFTHFIEDDMMVDVLSIAKELNNQFDFDFTNELKEYPFNKVLKALHLQDIFNSTLKDAFLTCAEDSSSIKDFKYIIMRPNKGGGNLITIGIYLKSESGKVIKSSLFSLGFNFIDWMEGFGIGYNKDKIEIQVERYFDELLQELNQLL